MQQVENNELPVPDTLFVPVGSGGTLAGLSLGIKNSPLDCQLVGIRVISPLFVNSWFVARLANNTATLIEEHSPLSPEPVTREDFELTGEYLGPGYGKATPELRNFLSRTRDKVSFRLDPTYTGKTLQALYQERRKRGLEDKVVLYWHTLSQVDLSVWTNKASKKDLPDEYHVYFE